MKRLIKQVASFDLTPPMWDAAIGRRHYEAAGIKIKE